ncbi:toll/interleukin-1 receptor domain-containing protein [Pseudomonas chlororaphis]|uniref:toll/interleukin-1 receptor domain-containing protein n=1 Tax=Pseudomonas chlororaphis TaxID=587753 RepID=UPI0004728BAB|nr:toll/interleukin-1 receptor domain-containing protein [Pseudomonas chlororaphis]
MKVFISWSGKRSKALAIALKDWLPLILQYAKPWVSDKDISGGDRWAQAVSSELETSNFGILCITPENLTSEWILFEAGALSKSMLDAKVIPLLWGLELSDLSGPLAQFQALKVDQNGMLNVAKAINAVAENKAADTTVEQLVPALWPQLQQKLDVIPDKEASDKHMRPQTEILEDLVSQVRGLGARMRDFDPEFLDRDMRNYNMRYRDNDPRMIDEMMHFLITHKNDMSLLVLAGLVRDRMPWLAEVLVEAHRDLKTANPEQARDIAQNVMSVVKITIRGPLSELIMGTKSGKRLIMELPHYIDRALSIRLNPRNILDDSDPDDGPIKDS